MFGSAERKAHEQTLAVYKALCEVLADEVRYLRTQLEARPQGFVPNAVPLNPAQQPIIQEGFPLHMSDEEAEFRRMFADGHINEDELDSALQIMGFNTDNKTPVGAEWEVD